MSTGSFNTKDFTANTQVSLQLSSGELISGTISSLSENYLELITSTAESARKIVIAYSHIVYVEQINMPTQVNLPK